MLSPCQKGKLCSHDLFDVTFNEQQLQKLFPLLFQQQEAGWSINISFISSLKTRNVFDARTVSD